MAEMTKERQGQIAFALLEADLDDSGGLKIGAKLRRELGDMSKKTQIPIDELEEFSKIMLTRQIGKAYGMQSVSLTLSDPVPRSRNDF